MSSPLSDARPSIDAQLLAAIREIGCSRCDPADPAHDALHLARVAANAAAIADAEQAEARAVDRFVVTAACWLHDIVLLPKGQGMPGEAARQSSLEAVAILASLGVGDVRQQAVAEAIAAHSFSSGRTPVTLEAQIVQDADRLDALGAVGIARFWATMVRMGGSMYDPDNPAGLGREPDDRRWAFDHIERKLLRLADLMNTAFARAEAERRTTFIRLYRDEFLRELRLPEGR